MITTPIGNSRIYTCEDTVTCVVQGVTEDTVHQIAEFVDAMNYVVGYIEGPQKPAESLKYWTGGEIVSAEKSKHIIKGLS
jgi:hypothetical protein